MFWPSLFCGVGIDVSDHHVRIAVVSRFAKVTKKIEIVLPEGWIEDDLVVKPEQVREHVQKEIQQAGFSMSGRMRANVLVPESRVFLSHFLFASSVKDQAIWQKALERGQEDIPIPFLRAMTGVVQATSTEGGIPTTVYAVEEKVVASLRAAFEGLFDVRVVEPHTTAILRAFLRFSEGKYKPHASDGLLGIVDVGSAFSTVAFCSPDGLTHLSRTLAYGKKTMKKKGDWLTRPTVDNIIETIREGIVYLKRNQLLVALILTSGVEAQDDDFQREYQLQHEGVPLLPVSLAANIPGVAQEDEYAFAAAIGAGLRMARSTSGLINFY